MSDSEDEVTTLQDPSSYTKAIPKNPVTHTVRGLTPDDYSDETSDNESINSGVPYLTKDALKEFFDRLPMLRVPLLFGALGLAARIAIAPSLPLEFPAREADLWPFVSLSDERAADFATRVAALWVPSVLAALFALSLAWTVGTAARHFVALCGVGVALLSLLAAGGQLFLLRGACGLSRISGRDECDVPFVLYWTLGVARGGGPLLAVWCAAPALDAVRRRGRPLRALLAVPPLGFAAAVLLSLLNAEPAIGAFGVCRYAVVLTWAVLLFECARIPTFIVRFEPKRHID